MSWRYPFVSGMRILGRALQEMAIGLARPDDLIRLNKRFFEREANKGTPLVNPVLFQPEEEFVQATGLKAGRVLIVGCGSGRDSIALAQKGFLITAIDQVPVLVEATRKNAARLNLSVETYCTEVTQATWSQATYDLILLPNLMYTYIPTRPRRIQTLERLRRAIKPGGWCYLRFLLSDSNSVSTNRWLHLMRRLTAWATWGNVECEAGDTLEHGLFEHRFSSIKAVEEEAEAAGWVIERGFLSHRNMDYMWVKSA